MTEVVRAATWRRTGITNVKQVIWTGLDADDSGADALLAKFADKTVQVKGTFGGATVTIYGSEDKTEVEADLAAGTLFGSKTATYAILTDTTETNLAVTAATKAAILQNPLYIRPVVTGGDGTTSITVTITAKRTV